MDSKIKEYHEAYRTATHQMAGFYAQAYEDLEYYLGQQYAAQEKEYLQRQRRNALVFNKIRKITNLISGYQRAHRMAFRLVPRSMGSTVTAQQLSTVLHSIMMGEGGYETLSKAFLQGPIKTGFAMINIWHDYSQDPVSGDLRLSYVPWSSFFLDPYFSRMDLLDCSYLGRRAWMGRELAKGIFPWAHKEIDNMPRTGRDSLYPYLARTIDPMQKDLHRVDEFWQLDYKSVQVIVDPRTGRWYEWPEDADEERLKVLLEKLPHLRVVRHTKRSMNLKMFLDDEPMYEGTDPLGIDDYNFVPFVGYYDYEYWDWQYKMQGVIRSLRDPQMEANRRRSKMLDLIDTQIHSGWKAEEGSVINPEDLYASGQGKVIWTTRNQLERVQSLRPGDIPQGMFRLAALMDQDIMNIAGINEDMLGQSAQGEERSNALLSAHRRYQGLMTLQELFDNYLESKKEVGRKLMLAIQQNYTQAKVAQIINEQPAPAFFSGEFGKYRVELDEVAITQTQSQLQFRQMFEARQAGAPIPWSIILRKAPFADKDEILQVMQQADQAEAQASQLEQKKQVAEIQETQAGAIEDQSQARLNRARAVSELFNAQTYKDKVEQDRMKALLQLATQIKDAEDEETESKDRKR